MLFLCSFLGGDTLHVIDLEGNEYPLQATTTNDYELNGNQFLTFRILPSKVNELFIHDITEMWEVVDLDGIKHKIVYLRKSVEGKKLSVQVKAIPKIYDDLDSQRIYERYDQHMTAQACFTLIFDGSGYNFVLVDSFEAVQWEGFGEGDTRLTLFKNALNRYGGEFRIQGNTVYIEKVIGRDTQFQYRYRLNASNIVQENDATAYYTYARGYGDYGDGEGGEDWRDAKLIREYTSPIASILGIREAPPIKNGNITTVETMDEQLKTLVDESLKISVSATIHDLRKQGYALAQPELGDRVFLIDERIGLDAEVRVVDMSITRNWKGEVIDLSLNFGTPGLVKRHQANMQSAIQSVNRLLEGKVKLPFSVLDNAVVQATKALQNMQSELSIPSNGGLLAVDKNNPNNVVVFNAAGIGVSDDGGATFKNSITGQGVVAETIVGNSIIGVNLSSVDETGYFHVNGSDAEFYDTTTSRRVAISPNGLYGYNANNSVRFQADSLLVTSRALGTTTDNVYLAAQSGKEARIVDMAGIPGDGEVGSYTYLPLRARGVYANYVEVNAGVTGSNLYLRPRSGGEVRVTGAGTTDAYYPLRAGRIYSNGYITTTTSMWMGTDSALHVVNKGYVEDSSGDPIYRDVYANDIWNRAMITRTTNAYIGADGELRVVNKGLDDIYRSVRALNYLLPSGEPAFANTFSLLSMPPKENEAMEMVSELNIVRHTSEGSPAFKLSNDPQVSTSDGSATDINKTLGLYGEAIKEIISRLDEMQGVN